MPDERDRRLRQAVDNNVAWCDAVCRAAAGRCHTSATLWTNTVASPRFYPNAITLTATATAAQSAVAALTATLADAFDWAVKDSFAALSLGSVGFDLLFDAQWIHRPAGAALSLGPAPVLTWQRVSSAAELADWESAWALNQSSGARVFAASLLDSPEIAFLAGRNGDRLVCGGVASQGAACLGLTNLFALPGAPTGWRAQAVAAAQATAPGLDLVGYEGGDELERLLALGFTALGPLRVWSRRRGVGEAHS